MTSTTQVSRSYTSNGSLNCGIIKVFIVYFSLTLLAAQEWQSGRVDQRPVCGEFPAAESSGDDRAAAENGREEELPTGREDLQPEQGRA